MLKVNLFDTNFAHSINEDGFDTATKGIKPTKIEYIRNLPEYDGVTIFTDEQMFSDNALTVKSKYKIGWCQESPGVKPFVYEYINKIEDRFDFIMTFSENLLQRNPDKYKLALIGNSWLKKNEWQVYPKTLPISIIASNKNFAPGHKLRHDIIKNLKGVDLWGSGYKKFNSKLEPLKDYMFTIAIMNFRLENYWTEVLTDCFATGTIPIFWGTPNIEKYFNKNGIITFNTIEELANIKLSKNDYYSRIDAIKDNFERAKKFISTDDLLAEAIEKLI